VSPQEKFSCSLGIDPSVKIKYDPIQKKTKSSGGGLSLYTKVDTTTFSQGIRIHNTRLVPIPRLVVRDQVHVSHDAKFKVTVLNPRELVAMGTVTKPSANPVSTPVAGQKGVRVQWALRNEDESGGEAENGIVEWICDVGAGDKLDLILAWEVSGPSGVKWAGEN
jgi:hypothetical protein